MKRIYWNVTIVRTGKILFCIFKYQLSIRIRVRFKINIWFYKTWKKNFASTDNVQHFSTSVRHYGLDPFVLITYFIFRSLIVSSSKADFISKSKCSSVPKLGDLLTCKSGKQYFNYSLFFIYQKFKISFSSIKWKNHFSKLYF